LIVDAVERIKQAIEVFGVSNSGFWHVADLIAAVEKLSEPILVGRDEISQLTILEDHSWLTAYLLRPERLPPELSVVVGYSPAISK
jgi:hypothetical protein